MKCHIDEWRNEIDYEVSVVNFNLNAGDEEVSMPTNIFSSDHFEMMSYRKTFNAGKWKDV